MLFRTASFNFARTLFTSVDLPPFCCMMMLLNLRQPRNEINSGGQNMSGCYYEKIARINLTTGEIKVEKLDLDLAHKFIGGRGLGTKLLYDEGCATVDPLSPENKLIYVTGPLTGTATPSSGRYMVVTKSPLTGMIASSNSGGIWGAKLKFAAGMPSSWKARHRNGLTSTSLTTRSSS
jgi:hypothetical protein